MLMHQHVLMLEQNLRKGDLFVISLNEDNTQKLVMEVDEARAGPCAMIQVIKSI